MIFNTNQTVPDIKSSFAVFLDDKKVSEGDDPRIVFRDAESEITHNGRIVILERGIVYSKDNATVVDMKMTLRGLSKGIAGWAIDQSYQDVKKNMSDLMIMGLTEAEAVIYIIKEYTMVPSFCAQKCAEVILNTEFSPQYFSRTFSNAKNKMSKFTNIDAVS